MKKLLLLMAALTVVAGTRYSLQLAPTAVITIEAWSPQQLHDAGLTTHQSTGLRVVGVNSLVYLLGSEAAGEDVISYQWSATSPTGVVIPTDSVGTERTTFRPNEIGNWNVELTITTASGTVSTGVTILAATYAGVGVLAGEIADSGEGQCGTCHSHNTADWLETGHASFFTEAIDGIKSSHYNEGCIECHTLGYDESADNNGFDDIAELVGWTFPAELVPGNWDDLVDNYQPLVQFTNIQCESCHGPGSEHKGNKANIDISVEVGVCAQCHEEEPYHARPIMWRKSKHATGNSFSRGSSSSCAGCHSSWGFIARIDPLSNLDQQVGKGEGVTCAACHDPHEVGDRHPHQLRTIADVELVDGTVVTWGGHGKLCMNCHHARRTGEAQVAGGTSRLDPHRSNQTDMLAGNNVAITFGRYIPSSTHRNALEDACVSCHMAPTPGAGEPGHFEIGDHTWKMYAEVDGVEIENTEVCQRCHGVLESFEDIQARYDYDEDGTVEGARDELRGTMENLAMLLPPYGEPIITTSLNGGAGNWPVVERQALFNYNFVDDDASEGIHNFQYAIGLMQVSIEAMHYGILSPGDIREVNDVPNDQGKRVQIVWERFGGDGVSSDPVATYSVWRQDGEAVAGKAPLPSIETIDVKTASPGVSASMAGQVWTFVGSVPAVQHDTYALDVPTLFDGVETTFVVEARTQNSTFPATSQPVAGMSIDNLVPTAPMGLIAHPRDNGVTLIWQELDLYHNPDVDYYAIYRGDVSGFVPGEPIATVTDAQFLDATVAQNTRYYYQVAAYDFSGNQGEFSGEVEAATFVGNEGMGLPTEFALHQNYPNPFNPSTTIVFDVPAASELSVVVYDLLGRQVKTLVSGTVEAGRHETAFDATGLTSGLYIVRMRTGDRVFERSIVLMK